MKRTYHATSRALIAALALSIASVFAARPAAAQETDRLLLATFCDLGNIDGATCKKARLYPDAGERACDVKLTAERQRGKFLANVPLLVIAYESGCEARATDNGGAVLFELVADKYVFRGFQPGMQPNDCVSVAKDAQQDALVCLTGHMGQGYLEGGVALMAFARQYEQQVGLSFDFLMTSVDSTGARGANTVACKDTSKYFGVSKIAAGPRPMTVIVNVDYADAAVIRTACGKGYPKPKETFGTLPKGERYVPDRYVKKGRFVIDLASRAVIPTK